MLKIKIAAFSILQKRNWSPQHVRLRIEKSDSSVTWEPGSMLCNSFCCRTLFIVLDLYTYIPLHMRCSGEIFLWSLRKLYKHYLSQCLSISDIAILTALFRREGNHCRRRQDWFLESQSGQIVHHMNSGPGLDSFMLL